MERGSRSEGARAAQRRGERNPQSDINSTLALQIQFLKLATLITRPMREFVAQPNGLTIDEIKILLCLGDRGALTGREISDLVALNTMAASRAIAHLDELGWLVRQDDARDKRRRPVALSDKGLAGHASIMPPIGQVAELIFGDFTELEQVALFDALARIERRLGEIAAMAEAASTDGLQE